MEPSFSIISIDKEVKFKKADLEALKDSQNRSLDCKYDRVTPLSNVKYCISIYPNGTHPFLRGKALIYLSVLIDKAKSVDADIEYFIESANFSTTLKRKYEMSKACASFVCKTSQLFDPANNFFTDNEMIIKIKGIFKIYLPLRIVYPISALWKIEEADLIPLKSSTTKNWLRSYTFNISSDSNVKYILVIYPNGRTDEQSGKVQIYFHLMGLEITSKIEAHINFSIDTAFYSQLCSHVYENDEGYGPSCVCSTDDLFDLEKRWIVDGKLILKVNGALMIEREAEPINLVLEKGIVQKGYHRGKNFTFFIGEKTVRVHKHVLKAASPVFEAMFDSKMKEAIEKNMVVVDFEYEIVHAAMKLLYSAAVPPTFTFEQMLQLLQFADKYDIGLIKDHVQAYLTEKFSPTNVCALIKFTSSTVDAPKLHFASVEYLVKRLEEKKAVNDLDSLEKDFILQILMRVTAQKL